MSTSVGEQSRMLQSLEEQSSFSDLVTPALNRRADIDIKQDRLMQLIQENECEGLLIFQPTNFRWFTSGAEMRGLHASSEAPLVYVSGQHRWLLCSSVDVNRFFDEELDEMGFQLKEWSWQTGRDALVFDLTHNRKIATDLAFRHFVPLAPALEKMRRVLSHYEQSCCREIGRLLVHALEATARNISPGDTEEEIAGHLSHRLLKHGVEPCAIQILGDRRGQRYRRAGATSYSVERNCLLQATGGKFGLYVTASRSVSFGTPDEEFHQCFDLATNVIGIYLTSSRVNEPFSRPLSLGQKYLRYGMGEHEWRLAPAGYLTGRLPAEQVLFPNSIDLFQSGLAVIWQSRIGAAATCDTFLLSESGWETITGVEDWPIRRLNIQNQKIDRPDIFEH